MMNDHQWVYRSAAETYDALVSHEDYTGNIPATLRALLPLEGLDIVELGAGTGRLTMLVAPYAARLLASDQSRPMLAIAREKLNQGRFANTSLYAADHRSLPLPDACADLVLSGWSICYLVDEHHPSWQTEVHRAIVEMRRVLRPGGMIILMETFGTGFTTPHPPAHLLGYFKLLEEQGFRSTWTRTDYCFPSEERMRSLVTFFFDEQTAQKSLPTEGKHILPECTGFWFLHST